MAVISLVIFLNILFLVGCAAQEAEIVKVTETTEDEVVEPEKEEEPIETENTLEQVIT